MLRAYGCLLTAVTLLLGGCAGFSQQECQIGDWRTVGFTDGAAGRPVTAIGNYRQACSKYGIAPNLQSYRGGYDEGVREFCRPAKGFEFGRSGGRYAGVCPADLEPDFVAAYRQGRQLYDLESALRATTQQIAYDKSELERLKKDTLESAAAIARDDTTSAERITLLSRTAENGRHEGELEKEIRQLQSTQLHQQRALDAYRSTVADKL